MCEQNWLFSFYVVSESYCRGKVHENRQVLRSGTMQSTPRLCRRPHTTSRNLSWCSATLSASQQPLGWGGTPKLGDQALLPISTWRQTFSFLAHYDQFYFFRCCDAFRWHLCLELMRGPNARNSRANSPKQPSQSDFSDVLISSTANPDFLCVRWLLQWLSQRNVNSLALESSSFPFWKVLWNKFKKET